MQVYSLAARFSCPRSKALQLPERAGSLAAQSQQSEGVVAQKHAGRRQRPVAGGAVEKGLAQRRFELANDLADRGLGAVQALGRAREAALLGDREKGLELGQIP